MIRVKSGAGTSSTSTVDTTNMVVTNVRKIENGKAGNLLGTGVLRHPVFSAKFIVLNGQFGPWVKFDQRTWFRDGNKDNLADSNIGRANAFDLSKSVQNAILAMWQGKIPNNDWRLDFDYSKVGELMTRIDNTKTTNTSKVLARFDIETDIGTIKSLTAFARPNDKYEFVEPNGFSKNLKTEETAVAGAKVAKEESTGRMGVYEDCYTVSDIAVTFLKKYCDENLFERYVPDVAEEDDDIASVVDDDENVG